MKSLIRLPTVLVLLYHLQKNDQNCIEPNSPVLFIFHICNVHYATIYIYVVRLCCKKNGFQAIGNRLTTLCDIF